MLVKEGGTGTVRIVIDESISHEKFTCNPGCGKYRIEVDPISSDSRECYMMLIEKKIQFLGIPIPIFPMRRAYIVDADDEELRRKIIQLFPDSVYVPIDFRDAIIKAYPYCSIQKFNPFSTNWIKFMNAELLYKWEPAIKKAVEQFSVFEQRIIN